MHPDGQVEFVFTLPASAVNAGFTGIHLPQQSSEISNQLITVDKHVNETAKEGIDEALESRLQKDIISTCRPLSVLIIDDEDLYRSGVELKIQRSPELKKFVTIVHASGSDTAIEAFRKQPFNLIITDVDMGTDSLNGFELVELFRGEFQYTGLICIHSNRLVMADHKTAILKGADAFLPKPITREHLLKLLLQAANRATDPQSSLKSAKMAEIALIEDDIFVAEMWEKSLANDVVVHVFDSAEQLYQTLEADPQLIQKLELVITDYYFDGSDETGMEVGKLVKSQRPDVPVYLSSSGHFNKADFVGAIDKIIAKEPLSYRSLLNVVGR